MPNPKTSPTMTYTVGDSETLVVNVSLGLANSPGMTAPTEEDWLASHRTGRGRQESNRTAFDLCNRSGAARGHRAGKLRDEPCLSSRLGGAHRQPGRRGCLSRRPCVPALPAPSTSGITNRQIAEVATPREGLLRGGSLVGGPIDDRLALQPYRQGHSAPKDVPGPAMWGLGAIPSVSIADPSAVDLTRCRLTRGRPG